MKLMRYGVFLVKEKLEIEVISMALSTEINLSWADGQIGSIPVFEDFESALKYADGNKEQIFNIKMFEGN